MLLSAPTQGFLDYFSVLVSLMAPSCPPAGLRAGRPVWDRHLLCRQPVAAWCADVHPAGAGRTGVSPRQPQGTAHGH